MGRFPRPPTDLVEDESVTASIEYGVMATLIGCTVLLGVAIYSGALRDMWNVIKDLVAKAL